MVFSLYKLFGWSGYKTGCSLNCLEIVWVTVTWEFTGIFFAVKGVVFPNADNHRAASIHLSK